MWLSLLRLLLKVSDAAELLLQLSNQKKLPSGAVILERVAASSGFLQGGQWPLYIDWKLKVMVEFAISPVLKLGDLVIYPIVRFGLLARCFFTKDHPKSIISHPNPRRYCKSLGRRSARSCGKVHETSFEEGGWGFVVSINIEHPYIHVHILVSWCRPFSGVSGESFV